MLYGRAREQAVVEALLDGARQGRSGALVLRGEPGIGRSALLDHAAERAGGDHRLIRVSGVEYEADLPFAGLHLLLGSALDRLPALPGPQRRALEIAFGLVDGGPADRLLSGLATLALLAELAADQPLLCLVDDAQWLDRSSSEALLLAARRLDREGVVLLFAARDGEGSFPAPGLPELRLTGLDPTAAAALLTSRQDSPAAERVRFRVLTQAQGNPLALTELPAALAADPTSGDGRLPLTGRLQQAFHGQVARLPAAAQTLLLVAAAEEAGDPAIVQRAGEALGAGPEHLAAAEQSGLLLLTPDGRYVLRNSLLRTVILQRAPLAQRLAVHRALGELLREAGEEDRGSWHLALAVTGKDAELAAALERVAERAGARGGHAGACTAYERAARLAPDPQHATRCLVLAAEAALDAAETDRAEALAVRAGERAEEPFVRAVLDWVRATAYFWRGAYPDAYRLLLTAADSEITAPDAARLLLQAFHVAWYLGAEQVEQVLDRLAALPLPDGDPTRAPAQHLLASALPMLGRAAPPLPAVADTVRLAREAGAEGLRELVQVCGSTLIPGRDAETFQLATELIAEARASGAVGSLPTLLFFLAEAELFHGRHQDAEVSVAEGLALARDTGQPQWLGQLLALEAYLAALRGDGERVSVRVAGALADATSTWGAPAAGTSWAQWAQAVHDLGQGRAAEAVDRLVALTGGPHWYHVSAVRAVPDLVEAAVRLGEPDRAAEAFERYQRWATPGSGAQSWAQALVLRCQALLGPDELAESGYLAALKLHDGDDRPFELARTSLLFGEWLRRGRRRTEARGRLRTALEVFERLGATPWADRARSELGAAGSTPPAALPAGPLAGLTPQEVHIVKLAAKGLSNRDIAAQLFLSPRTVGHHLYKAYPKLGVASRGELTALV
ncbi:DNA-binding CsgD family transcriptional regulator [Kitasatospora sp. MAP12-15]|uniref:helix-turn-helix transcriptional regulator n=1 Tax=unclassified Kitasatospora TaxID=2633591 RepID=UPI002476EC6E|nr:helix-turn-helix transcriptional regulator [Kitasatospora sp. MAP12-44]MDH6111569.1 DNA-binding CsgD family transcriptional regulator [Kitasatospora sp. MAP12-44]